LKNYSGKPVIVVFFLGYGCLHCAEQLQAFGPRAADFEEAGIDVVAISSDDQAGLQKSLENYTGEIPFTLVADPELEVFRQYRAFDDFEDQPLHGTFLIDGQGRMRWHDISYEPFMDPQFVLDEAKRLLNQEEKVEDGADDEEEEDGRSEATLANKSGA
jgi:peroxiredoxin